MRSSLHRQIIILFVLIAIISTLVGCRTNGKKQVSPIKVGDYVRFGSYNGEKILWKVTEINDGKPVLWSEYILSYKCFDAAESGKPTTGNTESERYGSNAWSNSNIREWLNAVGKVKWSTEPPTTEAVWGKNSYENEDGFLSGFTEEERAKIVKTKREIKVDDGSLVETTEDLVFLASYEEVKDGGRWGLVSNDRRKTPTEQAKKHDEENQFEPGKFDYFLDTPMGNCSYYIRYVSLGGATNMVDDCVSTSMGIVPALQLSSSTPVKGDGSRNNPWEF